MGNSKLFPEGMEPLGKESFQFSCHPSVPCFTTCCKKVDLILYPFDVIRLKNRLSIDSEEFLQKYARIVMGDNPFFPTVMLALTESGKGQCPFLNEEGCSVYTDRPTDCRTYPLERAVDRNPEKRGPKDYYFLKKHDYCQGHQEDLSVTVKDYIRSQSLEQFNTYNDLWAEVDTLFRNNPWKGEGAGGPGQQMAFMSTYNIDGFRRMALERKLFDQFKLSRKEKTRLENNDEELLKFGFEWVKLIFGGRSSLVRK